MKLNKVYGKGKALTVCYKGGHYASPSDTRVTPKDRVPVIVGEAPDTVAVLGETWTLKGTYVGAKKSPPGSGPR